MSAREVDAGCSLFKLRYIYIFFSSIVRNVLDCGETEWSCLDSIFLAIVLSSTWADAVVVEGPGVRVVRGTYW